MPAKRHLRAVPDPAQPRVEAHPLNIEQLAAQTGLSVRNLRSHRARGLLQPPVVRERVGYYGAEHLARVGLIKKLQGEGLNLAAIKRVLEVAPDGPNDDVSSALEAFNRPWETESPEVVSRDELITRMTPTNPDTAIDAAVAAGILIPLGNDRYEAPAPSLLDVAEELVNDGVPIEHAIAAVTKVRTACELVATTFLDLAVDDLWEPFAAAGFPAERWAELAATIERLRPMSAQVMLAVYQLTMSKQVEDTTTKILARMMGRK